MDPAGESEAAARETGSVSEKDSAKERPANAPEYREGVAVVKSPSYGLFYSQPEPGAPPYVQIGDRVSKGDTLGLVEIMKTFNAIAAEETGEVIAIHVKNEEQLAPGQPLFSIRCEGIN